MKRSELNCGKNETSIYRGYGAIVNNCSLVDSMAMNRHLVFSLIMFVLTILCHADGQAFTNTNRTTKRFHSPNDFPYLTLVHRGTENCITLEGGKKPDARDDFAETKAGEPVTINLLANDRSGNGGDDDDDDDDDGDDDEGNGGDDKIDSTSVDLNPSTSGNDKTLENSFGSFIEDGNGTLTYEPLATFVGTATIEYTISNKEGEISNPATIEVLVTAAELPLITGQNPDPIVIGEEESITIQFSNLNVTDADSDYPEGFTLSVLPGTNYSVTGATITPNDNFSGTLAVPVIINDGTGDSEAFSLEIVVNATNEAPVITGQSPNPLVTSEEQAITVSLDNLIVTDSDNTYPTGFSLQLSPGTGYTLNGNNVTPNSNFAGLLTVPVTVNDGTATSNSFDLKISVTPVNDAPVIIGQVALSTPEEQSITVQLNHLEVTDVDNTFPNGFLLKISGGANYTVSGTTVTPATDFSGTLTVPVVVNDSQTDSNPFNLSITVAQSNDVPSITGQTALTVAEDNSITIQLSNVIVSDSDNAYPTGFTLALADGANYSLSANTVVPDANFAGTLIVPVTVNDGTSSSAPFNLQIQVTPVNDAPQITAQQSLSANENQPITITLGNLTVVDPDNNYPTGFTLSVSGGTNYSVSGTTVTPSPGFNGTLQVPVTVSDGSASSAGFPLSILVNPVNDPPSITGQQELSTIEDTSFALQLSHLTVSDPDDIFPNDFAMTVLPGENYSFGGNTITPVQNFTGVITVNVKVNDGETDSAPFPVSLSVLPVNDAPLITGQTPLTVPEDQSLEISLQNLLVTDPDHFYPTGFSLLVSAGTNYVVTGSTITPAPDFTGVLSVPVQVNDGVENSNVFQVQVSVNAANDIPVIIGQIPAIVTEDTPFTIRLEDLVVVDIDNSYPTGFSLTVAPGANYSVSGNTVTPAQDFNGTLNISVTVSDGTSSSLPFTFQAQVGDANDPPVIVGQNPLSTNEEQAVEILLTHLLVSDPDNPFPTGFSLLVSPGENYIVSGNTIIPAINFAGTLTVPVRVNDGVNNSAIFDFKIDVIQVNDAPSFQPIANQQVLENGAGGQVTITGITKGPGEDFQQLTLFASSGNTAVVPDPTIVYNGGTTATLQYTLMPNASGLVTITVTAVDNGATGAPNQNTFSFSFQISVEEINQPPTLDAIANVIVMEDASASEIVFGGITAGPGEVQSLVVQASTNRPELFEIFQVVYTSPNPTGVLQVKPAAHANGVATVTLSVVDNGSSTSPSNNTTSRSFTITIQPVNDLPVFISSPNTLAAVGEIYIYEAQVSDLESSQLVISSTQKPAWLSIINLGSGKARLTGVPMPTDAGTSEIVLVVQDGELVVEQRFTLLVNTRPSVSNFQLATQEDIPITVGTMFPAHFVDADNNSLSAVLITKLPSYGTLAYNEIEVGLNDTLPPASVSSIVYIPGENYAGSDVFDFRASDAYHFSANTASVQIAISPVNDPPLVILETDTLLYEVNGEAVPFTTLLDIQDPDNDSLVRAEVGFRIQNFYPQYDLFTVSNSQHVQAQYDFANGKILFSGDAPIEEYISLIKSVLYTHLNTLDPALDMKSIYVNASDATSTGETKDRLIQLQYTFIELEIPSGFTPNGDQVNDTWVITRPNGVDQLVKAEVKIYNKRGVRVFRREGFSEPWDGTMDGKPLPADSYYYTIDLHLRNKKTYKGVITLLR